MDAPNGPRQPNDGGGSAVFPNFSGGRPLLLFGFSGIPSRKIQTNWEAPGNQRTGLAPSAMGAQSIAQQSRSVATLKSGSN
jgi:hypothetical protein